MELKLDHVTKRYGKLEALSDFSITFTQGIYGILGANGAGKSTMMNLITDNIRRDGGQITMDGREILEMGDEFRQCLGYMPQQQGLYEHMSAESFLTYVARLKAIRGKDAIRQVGHVLELVNLESVRHKKLREFSGGMRQRVLLAQALLGDPQVLILDEPTAGLDPRERVRIRTFIHEKRQAAAYGDSSGADCGGSAGLGAGRLSFEPGGCVLVFFGGISHGRVEENRL